MDSRTAGTTALFSLVASYAKRSKALQRPMPFASSFSPSTKTAEPPSSALVENPHLAQLVKIIDFTYEDHETNDNDGKAFSQNFHV